MASVPHHPDPRVYLRELGRAYRVNALTERNYCEKLQERLAKLAGGVEAARAAGRARRSR